MTKPAARLRVAMAVMIALGLGAPAPAEAQPAQITIAQPAEATTMDPGRSTQVLTVNYFYNLYDALTRWDASLKLVPALATSWRGVNETTWEFTLRQGVKFHDLMEQARYTLDPKKRKEHYAEATQIIHEEKPWLELFQEVVVYGTTRRVSFRPRPDYRLIVSEMTLTR